MSDPSALQELIELAEEPRSLEILAEQGDARASDYLIYTQSENEDLRKLYTPDYKAYRKLAEQARVKRASIMRAMK
jgi:hypothetical protein